LARGRTKFVVSSFFAVLWLSVSVAISIGWIRDVSKVVPAWYAVWVIIGIALLPGYLMSAMFVSNLLNVELEKIDCKEVGAVCVVVCARNEQATIYKTIERIVFQRYSSHIKILCVDNASLDDTSREIRRAAQRLTNRKRSICLLHCKTPGKSHALNMALKYIDTKYFITVDADTMLEENAVCAILSRIRNGAAGCVAGNLLVHNADTLMSKIQIYDYLISIAAVKRYQGSYNSPLLPKERSPHTTRPLLESWEAGGTALGKISC